MSDITITLVILGVAVALFVWNKLPVGIVALLVALSLWATGVIGLDQAVAGFGDPIVIFIAALFVVSEALDASGVTTWAGQQLIGVAGKSRSRLLVLMMVLVAILTALISVNGAVAALLPMVVVIAIRLGQAPSQLLLPLAFGAHAGSMLALTGTPINVIVSDAAMEAGEGAFGYFEFALVGIPLVAFTVLYAVFLGPKLLPDRLAPSLQRDLGDHARTLVRQYTLDDGVAWLRVKARSSLVGTVASDLDLSAFTGLRLLGVQTKSRRARLETPVVTGDTIIVSGDSDDIDRLIEAHDLARAAAPRGKSPHDGLITQEFGVTEVVVPPRSGLVGAVVFPGMVTESGDLVILAVQRGGEDQGSGTTVLVAGDTLLLQGTWDALSSNTIDPDVIVVDTPDTIRRQAAPLGSKAKVALIVLAGMVVLLATGIVPPVIAGAAAAIAMVLFRVVTVEQAHRSMSWTTLILIGAMIPLSVAITDTGAAKLIANGMVDLLGDYGPHVLLLAIVLFTVVLGQLISNTATALIVVPIALSIGAEFNVSVLPLLMGVTVAAAASFMTPIATPANLMVMGPGGYKFGDYWKFGLPLLLFSVLVATLLVPIIWPF